MTVGVGGLWADSAMTITNTAAYNAFMAGPRSEKTPFRLTGLVTKTCDDLYVVQDDTGRSVVFNTPPSITTGLVVRVSGWIQVRKDFEPVTFKDQRVEILGRAPVPAAMEIAIGDIDPLMHDCCKIVTRGVVQEVFPDDVDKNFDILLLNKEDATLPVFVQRAQRDWGALVGATVRVEGWYSVHVSGSRRYSGPFLSGCQVEVVAAAPDDPFDVPDLESSLYLQPSYVARLGRRKLRGRVLAVRGGRQLVVEAEDGRVVNVRLLRGERVPSAGDQVTAVGYPSTDRFRINLETAAVRVEPCDVVKQPERPIRMTLPSLIRKVDDIPRYDTAYHGRLIRLRGMVRDVREGVRCCGLLVADAGETVWVDMASCGLVVGEIPIGSEVDVTGVCFHEVDESGRHEVFPRISGITLIVRTRDDVVVLSMPSWWTTARLLAVIAALAVLLVLAVIGAYFWNRLLRRLVDRRGKELMREQIRASASVLKVDERTRLAVELHDTLSQNLAGVACQVSSGTDILERDPSEARRRLETADRMLRSCRTELKECLFDLRSSALECRQMDEAIQVSLGALTEDAKVVIRFAVRRTKLIDSTVHAIICIVRELVSNAIRHGGASKIRVAGATDADGVRFSVRDNGGGFDPQTCEGMATGHFGLSGIRDRVDRLDGAFEIISSPGQTRAVVFLPHPQNHEHE